MRNIFRALFVALITSLFIMRPAVSYADWNGHDSNGHSHDSGHSHNSGHGYDRGRGHSYIGVGFSVWPDNYYYGTSYYPSDDAVLVSSPAYQPVVINGITYYLNDGSYYIYNGYGYQPVAPPAAVVQPPAVVEPPEVVDNQAPPAAPVITAAGTTSSDAADSITINIPNNKGGYTAVTLKKSGNGYTGPQGEFYPEFPKVSQLKVIYGK